MVAFPTPSQEPSASQSSPFGVRHSANAAYDESPRNERYTLAHQAHPDVVSLTASEPAASHHSRSTSRTIAAELEASQPSKTATKGSRTAVELDSSPRANSTSETAVSRLSQPTSQTDRSPGSTSIELSLVELEGSLPSRRDGLPLSTGGARAAASATSSAPISRPPPLPPRRYDPSQLYGRHNSKVTNTDGTVERLRNSEIVHHLHLCFEDTGGFNLELERLCLRKLDSRLRKCPKNDVSHLLVPTAAGITNHYAHQHIFAKLGRVRGDQKQHSRSSAFRPEHFQHLTDEAAYC
ncbi:hypothetical protein BU26DRAFT_552417 [Trematosphaeria pertusa]|uniref:Uncharacterized protein n=1 Tax=Trematosphaeria pertusa TaxID=390896 RepID=A0A6A6I9Z5_9PLEO|nr:uncharacterized protein BU26DRAFT_552417 [Trematosphaeria pertusa]KAF2246360.1 hypothetical protein BU26DRAFT_552417 [Trematosphaeria pertusa]